MQKPSASTPLPAATLALLLTLPACGGLTGMGGRTGEERGKPGRQRPPAPLELVNPLPIPRKGEILKIPAGLVEKFVPGAARRGVSCWISGREVPSQWDPGAGLVVLVDVPPSGKLPLRLAGPSSRATSWPRWAHAEISQRSLVVDRGRGKLKTGGPWIPKKEVLVPPRHTDHDDLYRFEGPGWESDLLAWRLYLDWRCATDLFGKRIPDNVLPRIGRDGAPSYHELNDWGQDVLKVGNALGVGGGGFWADQKALHFSKADSLECVVAADGPVFARIILVFHGLELPGGSKADLTWGITTFAHNRYSEYRIQAFRVTRKAGPIPPFCAGLVRHLKEVSRGPVPGEPSMVWVASYGAQALAKPPYQGLGMAILARKSEIEAIRTLPEEDVFVFKKKTGPAGLPTWWALAAWSGEPDPIRNRAAFLVETERIARRLAHPLILQERRR